MNLTFSPSSFYTDASDQDILNAIPALRVPVAANEISSASIIVVGNTIGGLATAACLKNAGFDNVNVFEDSSRGSDGRWVVLDDASIAILKGIDVLGNSENSLQIRKMRWTEDRLSDGTIICRQPCPYFTANNLEILQALSGILPNGCLLSGSKVNSFERMENGKIKVYVENGTSHDCDIIIAANDPRSTFRHQVTPFASNLLFNGYAAWRGCIIESSLDLIVRKAIRTEFPYLGNCLYYCHGNNTAVPGQYAVLYVAGNDVLSWIVYETRENPLEIREDNQATTSTAPEASLQMFLSTAVANWGAGLGQLIQHTDQILAFNVYDYENPIHSFVKGNIALLGDAAHPCPLSLDFAANMALQDAFTLAYGAERVSNTIDMLHAYSAARAKTCADWVLICRYMNQLRTSVLTTSSQTPFDRCNFQRLVLASNLTESLHTLPLHPIFKPLQVFVDAHLPKKNRGYLLQRSSAVATSIPIKSVNHFSYETSALQVDVLVKFYEQVLGFKRIPRPDFGFGGAWLQLPGQLTLHIIERDPQKPSSSVFNRTLAESSVLIERLPEKYIRRGNHIAFTVEDIDVAKARLSYHSIHFHVNQVPGKQTEQLFIYDPDNNGIEIGNFDLKDSSTSNLASSHLTFYSSWFCPYAQRVWIALEEKQIVYKYVEIDPYEPSLRPGSYTKKPLSLDEKRRRYPEWITASPRGLVPALTLPTGTVNGTSGDTAGGTVCDSMVCLEFIDEAFPSNNGFSLYPPELTPVDRAKLRYWSVFANEKIIPFYYKMLMAAAENDREQAKSSIIAGLTEFANAMEIADNGPYFLGHLYSVIDIVLFPWYERLLSVCAAYRNFVVPSTNEFTRLQKWYHGVRSRPSVAVTLADKESLIANYSGYADNSASSDAATRFR